MKKIIVFSFLISLSFASFSQVRTGPSAVYKNDLLKKSKHQNTAGVILITGGGALVLAGMVVYPKDYNWLFGDTPEKENKANTAGVLVLTGMASMAASIPFFIIASSNKKKAGNANSLGFRMETAPVISHRSFSPQSYPALSLKIPL